MTPELASAVAEAYRVFAPYRIGADLEVCHCPSCMTEDVERELMATPLREIPAELLAEYTNSAHGFTPGRVANELRHFLPRYFELIAEHKPPCHMGLDICLRRLGLAGYRTHWPAEEVEVIDAFFDAFLVSCLPPLALVQWPAGWALEFSIIDAVTMAVTAGCDVPRLLAAWDRGADPAAAIHMAALSGSLLTDARAPYLHSPYLEDHREAAAVVGEWLCRPAISDRIEAVFFTVGEPRLQKLLSDGLTTLRNVPRRN